MVSRCTFKTLFEHFDFYIELKKLDRLVEFFYSQKSEQPSVVPATQTTSPSRRSIPGSGFV